MRLRRGCAFELVLAGDGALRGAIEERVRALGLQEHVRITGWIGSVEVRKELEAARALVLPSFAEGLPVVIMEAMALRRPVITTYVAGIPELVRSGESGWLVPAGDVDALADTIVECLDASGELLERMGRAARERCWRATTSTSKPGSSASCSDFSWVRRRDFGGRSRWRRRGAAVIAVIMRPCPPAC